jgi:hypothetical protein
MEYIQLESSQSEIPSRYQEATVNNYIQLYDERGNPINPRSNDYAKKLRSAQNDVLASVGVLEKRRSLTEGLPGPNDERLGLLEAEDTVGNAIALTSTLTENLCTWWVGIIRERLLVGRHIFILERLLILYRPFGIMIRFLLARLSHRSAHYLERL